MAAVKLKSEVTGSVWKILAKPGQRLVAGETVLIVESMKMEIPVASPLNGELKELLVREGQQIDEGQDLVSIETPADET